VLAALRAGLSTTDDVAGRIYPDVSPAMMPMARDTVIAHLQKLVRDGRVRRVIEPETTAEAWHIMEP